MLYLGDITTTQRILMCQENAESTIIHKHMANIASYTRAWHMDMCLTCVDMSYILISHTAVVTLLLLLLVFRW